MSSEIWYPTDGMLEMWDITVAYWKRVVLFRIRLCVIYSNCRFIGRVTYRIVFRSFLLEVFQLLTLPCRILCAVWDRSFWVKIRLSCITVIADVIMMTSSNGNISPHKGQRRPTLMFSLISARINGWVNNGEAGDLRRIRPHYDVTVMW